MVFAKRHDYGQAHARGRILLLDRRWGTFRNRDHFRVDRLVLHPYERFRIRWNDKTNRSHCVSCTLILAIRPKGKKMLYKLKTNYIIL